jgi:cell cycle arrest protein BUB3
VYLYSIGPDPGSPDEKKCSLLQTFEHRAPVLDVCFGASDEEFYSAGLDWDVRHADTTTSEQTVLSTHDGGVKSVVYSKEHNLVISASWDATLHVHQSTAPSSPPAIIPLPSKVFAVSITPTKLVVGMASRAFNIYELSTLAKAAADAATQSSSAKMEVDLYQRREGSLKFMTRAVATMPTDSGYASSSIEGRVAVEWFDASSESQSRKYAFKCHRQTVDGVDVVYPVNALAFHPVHGTFASGGGDGLVALWDGVAKRRIRQYPKYGSSVAALAFSMDGRYLAVAVSPGFEDGKDEIAEGSVNIFIREMGPTEAKGKGAK